MSSSQPTPAHYEILKNVIKSKVDEKKLAIIKAKYEANYQNSREDSDSSKSSDEEEAVAPLEKI